MSFQLNFILQSSWSISLPGRSNGLTNPFPLCLGLKCHRRGLDKRPYCNTSEERQPQFCDNWRGITLLSAPSKVFCHILLGILDSAIDKRLREEQAGFNKGRGCIDQIFTIRNIIEQCLEWNSPLYINFIDFQKAFDSLHRGTLWKILQSCGVPDKLIVLIKLFYHHFECSVVVDGKLSE